MDNIGKGIDRLGFGAVHFPMLDDGKIDVERTKIVVVEFVDVEFDYSDVA